MKDSPTVGIIGGGLAGLAAASILCERDFGVEIFEAKRFLGGRAGSFIDPATGESVDYCQHVAMGCCTAFLDFCRRTGVDHLFRKDDVLHFYSPAGKRFDVKASPWLPAPLHLGPALMRLGYLSFGEKLSIARAMFALANVEQVSRPVRQRDSNSNRSGDLFHDEGTIGRWLREHRQSQRAIDRFWSVVLVSALGEELDRASIAAARKVFVDGFLAHREGYRVVVPQAPLGEIYEQGVARWLTERGVQIHLESPVDRIATDDDRVSHLSLRDGQRTMDDYVVATPWHVLPRLLDVNTLRELNISPASIDGSPITSIHLWFDRPITDLPHAVLIDRLTQWVFRHNVERVSRDVQNTQDNSNRSGDLFHEHYYQVVISASRDLAGSSKDSIIAEVLGDLRSAFPDAALANLLRHRIITQPNAVFSYRPGLDAIRPAQQTPIENLYLAGDWTATGWPSTMESAVRSGYLAAARILEKHGRKTHDVMPRHLPRNWLARRLIPPR